MMTHDWPSGVTKFGNEGRLRRLKPHFCDKNQLGNPVSLELLHVSCVLIMLYNSP